LSYFALDEELAPTLRLVAETFALLLASVGAAQENPPLLLRHPMLSATQIVFVYGEDLWSVPREGGVARRLTPVNWKRSRIAASIFAGWKRDRVHGYL
jgi:hypothetical protein